jgi:hypothetical protein
VSNHFTQQYAQFQKKSQVLRGLLIIRDSIRIGHYNRRRQGSAAAAA